jgi:hypothetical protein
VDGCLQYIDEHRPIIVPPALHHADAHPFSGKDARDEHGLAVDESQALPPGDETGDGKLVHGKNRSSTIAHRQW